jgi:alpha-beta hydrolase superfamily lysophospholipase
MAEPHSRRARRGDRGAALADPPTVAPAQGPEPEVIPAWLALEPDPVLAFLHEPPASAPRHRVAALICPPFGWEEMCSYRARRRWGQELAKAGFPAARIDLPGSADSGGSPRDPDRLDAWVQAIGEGAQWLRERSGADRVVAIGIGLGGVLACRALAGGAPIDDLILWAVPASGRKLVRELRAFGGVIAARHPEDLREGPPLPDGAFELIGFLLDAETARALSAIGLTELEIPPGRHRRVLLLGRDRLAPDSSLAAHFEHSGAEVTVAQPENEDYAELMSHPQEARLPVQTIARSIAWLERNLPLSGPGRRPGRAGSRERDSVELRSGETMIRETPIELQVDGGSAFAMLTEPVGVERAPVTSLLMNAGALRHIGPNRTWVELARRWAARGVASARVDLPGAGDGGSGDQLSLVSNPALYDAARITATLALADQLAARGMPDRFVITGLCSGAYWALHAALIDPRIAGAFMINLYAFRWSRELVAERETHESLTALRGEGWRRLVKGQVTPQRIVTVASSIRPSRLRTGAQLSIERQQSDEIEDAFERLRDQGTEALLLFSHGEPLHEQLTRQGVIERQMTWPNVAFEALPSRDHMFRALWLQQFVHGSLDRALDRVLDPALR